MRAAAEAALSLIVLAMGGFQVAATQDTAEPAPQSVKPVVIKSAYDIPALIRQSQVPQNVFRGRVLWVQRCALCHDGVGQPTYHTMGPWLGAGTVKNLGDPAVRAIIAAGTASMPEFRYDLTAQQVSDLLAFLKTVTWKPTAAELAVKGGFGHGGS